VLTLEEMIDAKAGREIKRAVAVKMALQGFQTKDICELLEVSDAFVSKWKIIYQNQGAEGLRLHYHGSEGFLTAAQRDEVIVEWRCRTTCEVAELRDWIESRYGVVYKSKQSYYDLLAEVAMSRRKTQPENQKRDEQQVLARRDDIKKPRSPATGDTVRASSCFC
jgi:transposase